MVFLKNKQRTRVTMATMRRIANHTMLVDALKVRNLLVSEMCELLQVTPSGGRKYKQELQDAGAIHIVGYQDANLPRFIGYAIYALTSVKAGDKFLADIAQPEPKHSESWIRRQAKMGHDQAGSSGRRVHILVDDIRYKIPNNHIVAQRDPLIEALFGPAKVSA